MRSQCEQYAALLADTLRDFDWGPVEKLGAALLECRDRGGRVFICGNGGSAANAIHLANDFLYGIACKNGKALKVTALPANNAVLTCLANDLSYEEIFSHQLDVLGEEGDVLVALSGSGNSPNILRAIDRAKAKKLRSFAILGYSGGKSLDLADVPIHVPVDDMQVSEDFQMIIGHILMKWLADQE